MLSSFIVVYIVIWVSLAIDALTYSLSAAAAELPAEPEATDLAGEVRRCLFGGAAFCTTRCGGG